MNILAIFFSSIYVYILGVLPSSTIFNFPVKMLFFIFFLMTGILCFCSHYKRIKFYSFDILHVFALSCLLINCIVGVFNGVDIKDVFSQVSPFFVTLITVVVFIALIRCNVVSHTFVTKLIYISSFSFGLFKTILVFSLFFGFLSWSSMLNFFEITAYSPIGLPIAGGGARLSYVVLDLSFLLVYCHWLFFGREKNGYFRMVINLIALMVVFSAFSRYLFFLYFLALMIKVFIGGARLKVISFILVCVFLFFNFEYVYSVVSQRFFNQEHSDSDRVEMYEKLSTATDNLNTLLVGHGAGAHVAGFVRSNDYPYSYELQPLAFLFQFGVWWVVYVFFYLCLLFYRSLELFIYESKIYEYMNFGSSLLRRELLFVLICFIFMILASFTNQYIGSTSLTGVYLLWVCSYGKVRYACEQAKFAVLTQQSWIPS